MPFIRRNGLNLWFETKGSSGSPVVLIMGLGGRGLFWEPQIEGLRGNHQILYFDNRGVGDSDCPDGGVTMVEMASDVAALMDHQGWETAHIIGMSMGGMVAQEVALQFRHRVRSLTLIATTAVGIRGGLSTPSALPMFFATFFGSKTSRKKAAGQVLFPASVLRDGAESILNRVFQRKFNPKISVKGVLSLVQAVVFHNTEASLSQLEGLPTLVVWGEKDILISPKEARRLANSIPGAKVISFENAGHGINWQCSDELNRAITSHLSGVDQDLKRASMLSLARAGKNAL